MSDLQHARLAELCAELRLQAVPAAYGALAQAASERDTPYAVFLEEVLRAEREARRTRAREMFARVAGFPAVKTLEGYDFGFATGAPRAQIQELASLAFVERAQNVVFLGPSGVGKTHLAIALGQPHAQRHLWVRARPVALGRAAEAGSLAGPSLADTVGHLQMAGDLAANGGPHHFRLSTSCSMERSSVRSATNRLSLLFSSSNCFRRRISGTPMPTNCFFQR
jgi:hypothetical protein